MLASVLILSERRLRLVLAFVLLATMQGLAERRLFILAGQSNMVGQSPWANQGFPDSIPEVRIWVENHRLDGAWGPLRPGLAEDSLCFGPEITLGQTLLAAMPNDTFVMVKVAWSATSLAVHWLPPSAGGPGERYSWMLDGVSKALADLPGSPPLFDGFFWMQGENDGFYDSTSNAYAARLASLVLDLRRTWNNTLPIVVGLIDLQPAWPYASVIREAQVGVSDAFSNMGYVETAGLGTDGVHYTADGLKALGRLMGERWLELKGYRSTPVSARYSWRVHSHGNLLLWFNKEAVPATIRFVDIDGRASAWATCPNPLNLSYGRRHAFRSRFVQLRAHDGTIETLRIPAIWR